MTSLTAKSRKVVAGLKDETGAPVQSEKMMEIDWNGLRIQKVGNQFGIGRKTE